MCSREGTHNRLSPAHSSKGRVFMADLLDVLGLSRPVAECAVCLEIYDDQLTGVFEACMLHQQLG
jgi:hypothetical protein